MFIIPEYLAELGKRRIEGYPVDGFVYGKGPDHPTLMLVGEAPGEQELIDGIPFIGRAGKELMASLSMIGLTREDVYITSAVRSRPYKWGTKRERNGDMIEKKYNRPPKKPEIFAHAPILDYEISHLHPPLIVTLGNVGLQRLIGPTAKVTELHGRRIESSVQYLPDYSKDQFAWTNQKYTIIPTFHPASVFYRPSHREKLEQDWQEIGRYIKENE
ncbi:uracil-DNA glycosylase [Halalkalibacillus halophilus]|uniref:uracil-DNA glycosylase n=1 Tax=Halalkalibacillus halophilus TaxID=392827 RepID=UPI00040FB571|nr:uracil-DNA glycosylase [Halalkalibacillus halophilus]